MTSDRRTRSVRTALALAVAATPFLVGCASEPRSAEIDIPATTVDKAAARALALRAQEAEKAGEVERAITLYREAIDTDPDAPAQWWNNLGALLMTKGREDYVNAAAAFRAAAALDLTDPRPRVNLGMVYYQAGRDAQALEAFSQALAIEPHDRDALRAAIRSQKRMLTVDRASLERAQRGLMVESDPVWREVFLREKIRLENQLQQAGGDAGR